MLCALKAHPTFPEVACQKRCQKTLQARIENQDRIENRTGSKIGAFVPKRSSQRAPRGLPDLFCIADQQVCQQLCLSHRPPVSI